MHLVTPILAASCVASVFLAAGHSLRAKLIAKTGAWMTSPGVTEVAVPSADAAARAERARNVATQVARVKRTALLWWLAAGACLVGAILA